MSPTTAQDDDEDVTGHDVYDVASPEGERELVEGFDSREDLEDHVKEMGARALRYARRQVAAAGTRG